VRTRMALIALSVCLLVASLGWLVTPRVDGEPVLLSPAVRGVLRYAAQGEEWMEDLEKVEQLLLDALPTCGGNVALPDPEAVRVAPGTLLNYTDRAKRAKELAMAVAKETNTTRPPEGLEGLHGKALDLSQSYTHLSAAVQEYLGVPTTEEAARIGQSISNLSLQRDAMMQNYRALALR
jgi:hypothetical protein